MHEDLQALLTSRCLTYKAVYAAEARGLAKRWRSTFARNTKAKTGVETYRGFDWHTFSYKYADCRSGQEAVDLYREAATERRHYILSFDEKPGGAIVQDLGGLDLGVLYLDLYVFPASLEWTMVFTHEYPEIGPFFARAEWQVVESQRGRKRRRKR
jgi:hypothetical protein